MPPRVEPPAAAVMADESRTESLKSQTVLFLAREKGTERDRDAAKLLARCDVEVRHVTPSDTRKPAADVLIHADRRTIDAIKSSPAAGRIENAMREATPSPIRYLQWVGEQRSGGPSSGAAIGDGSSGE